MTLPDRDDLTEAILDGIDRFNDQDMPLPLLAERVADHLLAFLQDRHCEDLAKAHAEGVWA